MFVQFMVSCAGSVCGQLCWVSLWSVVLGQFVVSCAGSVCGQLCWVSLWSTAVTLSLLVLCSCMKTQFPANISTLSHD